MIRNVGQGLAGVLALHQTAHIRALSAPRARDNPHMPLIQPKSAMSSGTPALQPGSSYAQPFELLGACHERVQRSLDLLERLLAHLQEQQACDEAARSAARDVLRYFDVAAPLHHQDEELHVFPALEAGGDAAQKQACAELRAQHVQISAAWQALRRPLHELAALPDGPLNGPLDSHLLQDLTPAATLFVRLHDAHLRTEDGLVFPAAAALLAEPAQAEMGREMAARRGLAI